MKKQITYSIIIPLIAVLLSGCHTVGAKTASISYIYGTTAMLSLILLISYCWLIKKKNAWGFLLFSSVLVVNIGYFCLSISKTLEEALLANRIAYLGSVFLPMAILMIILDTSNLSYKKWFPTLLLIVGFLVFLVAASPGYLNIYYKEVALDTIRGATCLRKTYGSWHILYLSYLLCYMCGMYGAISYALIKKKIESVMHTVILVCAASVNWGVWLIEQLVEIEFEILSISYIITELFLLGLTVVMSEIEKLKEVRNF